MKILAIGAHPDDIEIGCAGTLLYLKEKYNAEICMLLMTIGSEGNCEVKCRDAEQDRACELLGTDIYHCAGLPDTAIELKDAICEIERFVSKMNPSYIFTHYREDTHQDHRTVAVATTSACRNQMNLLFYESISTEIFHPTVLVDINETFSKKCDAVKAHESQDRRLQLVDYVQTLAKFRAHRTGLKHAEGFIPRKFLWR